MIDISNIQHQRDNYRFAIREKNVKVDLDKLLQLDEQRRELLVRAEVLRAERNTASKVGNERPSDEQVARVKELKQVLTGIEEELNKVQAELDDIAQQVPNLIPSDTPHGGEENNVTVDAWGDQPEHDFEALDHLSLSEKRGWLDFERGAKVAGSKFYYSFGELVQLELALTNFVMDQVVEHGFKPVIVPHMVNQRTNEGTGYAPRGEERQTYHIEGEDLNLIATAEVPLTGLHADETLDLTEPLQYAGLSPAYRMEAGAYGKYNKGLFRVHQFNKVELYVYCRPEDSEDWHQKLLELEEKICQQLEIPYRVVRIAAGDLGAPAYKKFDIEYWSPIDKHYRELMSCSNVTDYQAQRMNIRLKSGSSRYVHTLNATAMPMSRGIIAILDNYQQADGSVTVPKALRSYLGNKEVL